MPSIPEAPHSPTPPPIVSQLSPPATPQNDDVPTPVNTSTPEKQATTSSQEEPVNTSTPEKQTTTSSHEEPVNTSTPEKQEEAVVEVEVTPQIPSTSTSICTQREGSTHKGKERERRPCPVPECKGALHKNLWNHIFQTHKSQGKYSRKFIHLLHTSLLLILVLQTSIAAYKHTVITKKHYLTCCLFNLQWRS